MKGQVGCRQAERERESESKRERDCRYLMQCISSLTLFLSARSSIILSQLLIRFLDNDSVTHEQVNEIHDDVEYFISDSQVNSRGKK